MNFAEIDLSFHSMFAKLCALNIVQLYLGVKSYLRCDLSNNAHNTECMGS